MSLQTYSLTPPVFGSTQSSREGVRAEVLESLGYFSKRLFGCWHLRMGRPLTLGTHTHRTCAKCGMRRDFDLATWKMKGRYYCDPVGQRRLTLARTREAVAVNIRKETGGQMRRSFCLTLLAGLMVRALVQPVRTDSYATHISPIELGCIRTRPDSSWPRPCAETLTLTPRFGLSYSSYFKGHRAAF